ncbi:MAG: VWA domain-containing protein, partial [Pirellulaceae bacterium]
PDYLAREEYLRQVGKSRLRSSLLRAAVVSDAGQLTTPNRRFVKSDEAAFTTALTEAQKAAAVLEPRLNALYALLQQGEKDRPQEIEPRWQAGFDLAIGRVMAARVRAQGYNAMLAAAKRGLKFADEKNNTWVLNPADEISTGSQLSKAAQAAEEYLERVVREHPETPWAMLAALELRTPLGWKWSETFTDLAPRVAAAGNNNNNNNRPPPTARPLSLPKPPPKRSPPKL